jgi:hypothetical protein
MRQLLDAGADTEAKDTVRGLVRRVRGCLFLFAFSFRIPLTVFFLLFYHAWLVFIFERQARVNDVGEEMMRFQINSSFELLLFLKLMGVRAIDEKKLYW